MKTRLVKVGSNTKIRLKESAQLVLEATDLGVNDRHSLTLTFERPGLEAEILGAFKLSGKQVLNLSTIAVHKVPKTKCLTYIKGVLFDQAVSDYIGKIIIEPPAGQTTSYLEDNILLVGRGARSTSQPVLEIEADDVKASHGATAGPLNPEHIYYLRSRGLTEAEAKNVVIEGFFTSLLSRIKDEKIRNKVSRRLNVRS